jgi:hypothetical protein
MSIIPNREGNVCLFYDFPKSEFDMAVDVIETVSGDQLKQWKNIIHTSKW